MVAEHQTDLVEQMRVLRAEWGLDRKPAGEPCTSEEVATALSDSIRLLNEGRILPSRARLLSRLADRILTVEKQKLQLSKLQTQIDHTRQGALSAARIENMKPGDAVTIDEAAEYWHVSRGTIRNWIEKGLVQCTRTPSGRPRVILRTKDDLILERVLRPVRHRKKP